MPRFLRLFSSSGGKWRSSPIFDTNSMSTLTRHAAIRRGRFQPLDGKVAGATLVAEVDTEILPCRNSLPGNNLRSNHATKELQRFSSENIHDTLMALSLDKSCRRLLGRRSSRTVRVHSARLAATSLRGDWSKRTPSPWQTPPGRADQECGQLRFRSQQPRLRPNQRRRTMPDQSYIVRVSS